MKSLNKKLVKANDQLVKASTPKGSTRDAPAGEKKEEAEKPTRTQSTSNVQRNTSSSSSSSSSGSSSSASFSTGSRQPSGLSSAQSTPVAATGGLGAAASAPAKQSNADKAKGMAEARLADGSTSSMADLHLERNSVVIQAVGATGLKNVDLIGKSDPWVKLKIMDRSGVKHRTFKTKYINNNLNPSWNEEFLCIFQFGRSIEDYILEMEVYDHDASTNTFLGRAVAPMVDIMGKRPGRVMEMKLEPKKAGQTVKGTIKVSIRYPNAQEIEEMGANFSGKVAKALVGYIAYSCADSIAKLRPDAAVFECEAEISIFNIVFIYFLSILIPRNSTVDMFEIKKDMAYEQLKGAVLAKTSSKGKGMVKNLPTETQKALENFMPKFVDQATPVLEASRKAPASGQGTELQLGVGVKPIIKIPPPPAPPVVGAEVALKVIFAYIDDDAPAPPPTVFSALTVARDQPAPSKAVPAAKLATAPAKPAASSSSTTVAKAEGAEKKEGWKPDGENLGALDVENNSVVIRVEGVAGIKHKDISGKCKPYVMVDVTDRSGAQSKKFKTTIKTGQDATFEEDFLYIFPFGRSVEDFVVQCNVYHHALPSKRFLGYCERPMVDVMGVQKCEMELQPKKAGDFVKGTCSFSVRYPQGSDIEDIGSNISSKVTKHLVSYIMYSCADAIVKGATLPSVVRFECEAEVTLFGICFIFIMTISIPYGTPPSKFETSKAVSYENLRISVATKGVPKMFEKVPPSTQKMVDGYLPRFMEQLMPVIEGARKPSDGDPVYLELGIGMKPGFTLPLPPNPPVLSGEIAFIVFMGTGQDTSNRAAPKPQVFQKMIGEQGNPDEELIKQNMNERAVHEAKNPQESDGPKTLGALDLENGSLIIDVISASGLKNVDVSGKSDPWVKIKVCETNGKKLKNFRTEAIDNNLNPEWNEKFLFVFPFNRTSEDLALQFEVYDKGLTGRTFLGMCEQSLVNILRDHSGKPVEMTLQPKAKGDHVKGSLRFAVRKPSPKDIEELGADMPSKLARNLIAYLTFAFANAIVKLKPRNARFEAEAEVSVFNMCFIFCATIVIPLGTSIDAFEMKRDKAFEMLEICVAQQSKKIFKKIPENTQALTKKILPAFMERVTPLVEASRDQSEQKIQAQTGIGVKPEFALPFPPAPAVVTGSLALRAIFGIGSHATAAPFRSFAFHEAVAAGDTSNLREIPQ